MGDGCPELNLFSRTKPVHPNAIRNHVPLDVRTKKRTITFGHQKSNVMTAISASEARANLYRLIDEATETHKPLLISGKRNKAVLVSEEDWEAIQETMFLLSVQGMRESIRDGMKTPIDECSEELDW